MEKNRLLTKENLHNFNFTATKFFAKKLKSKKILLRQIAFDSPMPDTYFALDQVSFELFLHFDAFGNKEHPRLIPIGTMPKDYIEAIELIAQLEVKFLKLITRTDYEVLKQIETKDDLLKLVDL